MEETVNNPEVAEIRLSCDICLQQFKSNDSKMRHIKRLHNDLVYKRFKCPHKLCPQNCASLAELKRHIPTHTGEKNFTCTYCGKSFAKDYGLTKHITLHTKETPYSCPIPTCTSKFNRKDLIERHIYSKHRSIVTTNPILSTKKSFSQVACSFCSKLYYKSGLENHLRTHTKEKPFCCVLCDFETVTKGSLTQHYKRVHPDPGSNSEYVIKPINLGGI